jgi:hypothetical protein
MARFRHLCAASALALWVSSVAACGTDAIGTDSCRKIEQARCRKGPSCPALALQGVTGVEECAQFARDRCLHGLAVPDPGPAVVDPCVSAIDKASSCDVVISPASAPACAFLQPAPPTPEDAGVDAPEAAMDPAPPDAEPGPAEGG